MNVYLRLPAVSELRSGARASEPLWGSPQRWNCAVRRGNDRCDALFFRIQPAAKCPEVFPRICQHSLHDLLEIVASRLFIEGHVASRHPAPLVQLASSQTGYRSFRRPTTRDKRRADFRIRLVRHWLGWLFLRRGRFFLLQHQFKEKPRKHFRPVFREMSKVTHGTFALRVLALRKSEKDRLLQRYRHFILASLRATSTRMPLTLLRDQQFDALFCCHLPLLQLKVLLGVALF